MRGLLFLSLVLAGCGANLRLPTHAEPLRPADAIVVLGNRPPVDHAGNVRAETARRVRRGVLLFEQGLAPTLLFTGGRDRAHVEAEVMRDYAVELGVPASAILTEERARDTVENAAFSLDLLCHERPSGAHCLPRVILVSSPYHLPRARPLFECAGARVQVAASAVPEHDERYHRRARFLERAARLLYGFRDPCRRIRWLRQRSRTR